MALPGRKRSEGWITFAFLVELWILGESSAGQGSALARPSSDGSPGLDTLPYFLANKLW